MLFSPHLAWRNEPLRDALSDRIGMPGDRRERRQRRRLGRVPLRGRPGRSRVVVCVTLGTGIGGGLVVDGEVYRGAYGVACEYGHMTVVPDGRRCACGNRGCWEMYASGALWPATRANSPRSRRWQPLGCSNWPAMPPS